jgi:hypothetical protein
LSAPSRPDTSPPGGVLHLKQPQHFGSTAHVKRTDFTLAPEPTLMGTKGELRRQHLVHPTGTAVIKPTRLGTKKPSAMALGGMSVRA